MRHQEYYGPPVLGNEGVGVLVTIGQGTVLSL